MNKIVKHYDLTTLETVRNTITQQQEMRNFKNPYFYTS